MFGYVKQEDFDAERAARKAADAEQRRMEEEIRFLSATCKGYETRIFDLCDERDALRLASREERESRFKETALLLQHIAPLQPERPSPETTPYKSPTYDEIMAEPASTKREMFYREIRANRARELAYSEAEREAVRIRNENMTDEEREAMRPDSVYDAVLGVAVPVAKDGAEDNVN